MAEGTKPGFETVPAWVDSIKGNPEFPMTRLQYFTLEVRHPLTFEDQPEMPGDLPVLVSNLSAIVQGPSRDREHFSRAEDLMELFDSIRRDGRFSLTSPTLWLPNAVFPSDPPVRRGAVYRIPRALFMAGLQFRSGGLSQLQIASEVPDKPEFSPKETEALANWSRQQIDISKRAYKERKDAGRYLHWAGEATE